MPQTFEDGFVAAHSASEAVDRLAALHQQATQALSSALKRYLKDRIEPTEAERQLFRYPEIRLCYRSSQAVPTTTRAYA